MPSRTPIVLSSMTLAAVVASGCASRADLASLQREIDALERISEAQQRDAAEALEIARRNAEELDDVRATAERAARDAAETRRLLESLDERMAGELGAGTLK